MLNKVIVFIVALIFGEPGTPLDDPPIVEPVYEQAVNTITIALARTEPLEIEVIEPETIEPIDPPEIACFCVRASRYFGANVPYQDAKFFRPNTGPHIGAVAIFNFNGIAHITGPLRRFSKDGARFLVSQGNKTPCQFNEEWYDFDNQYLVGFYEYQSIAKR